MTKPGTPNPQTFFQSFEEKSDPSDIAGRAKKLREAMHAANVQVYLLPRGDKFRGENVPPHAQRLAWLTGFTGSAGLAIIGMERAALCVDGRYALQAPTQTDTNVFDVIDAAQGGIPEEIVDYVPTGCRFGFDPWVHAPRELGALRKILKGKAELVPIDNLIDKIWNTERPFPDYQPIEFLDDSRAGVSSAQKLADLRATMSNEQADAVFLSMPESVCWLFNLRGRDVPHTPFVLAYALIPAIGKPTIFIDMNGIDTKTKMLSKNADFASLSEVSSHITSVVADGKIVWCDPATCPVAIAEILDAQGAEHVQKPDPVSIPKSRKNATELAGMRDAHKRDGIAMVRFLAWLDTNAPAGALSEIDIVAQLEAFRREDDTLVDISFDTIAGAGPNGAIIHYHVTEHTNRVLSRGEILLVDSGGQYLSGTTDITRTISTGPVTAEQKDRYTRVLKGMIAVSTLSFPKGTSGAQIDILARQPLWQIGLNYAHGTGHGVGAFLSVHEGPIGISPRAVSPLHPGNILSNEPGFYVPGEYGIRIENLLHVTKSEIGAEYCQFETLTLAPIDTRLVEQSLLTNDERHWLNAYHARVHYEITPHLSTPDKAWLADATKPV